jgi:uncharacterized protein involved in outer membrane biogenesis
MLKLGRLDLELPLFPLIGREVLVERLVISDLVTNLEVNEAGEANWIFPAGLEGEPGEMEDPGESAPLANLRLGDVRLENAQLAYRDLASSISKPHFPISRPSWGSPVVSCSTTSSSASM